MVCEKQDMLPIESILLSFEKSLKTPIFRSSTILKRVLIVKNLKRQTSANLLRGQKQKENTTK